MALQKEFFKIAQSYEDLLYTTVFNAIRTFYLYRRLSLSSQTFYKTYNL